MSECKNELLKNKDNWTVITVLGAFLSIPLIVFIKALFIMSMLDLAYKNYQLNGITILTGVTLIAVMAILKRQADRPFCHSRCHFNVILLDTVYIAIIGLSFQLYSWIAGYA